MDTESIFLEAMRKAVEQGIYLSPHRQSQQFAPRAIIRAGLVPDDISESVLRLGMEFALNSGAVYINQLGRERGRIYVSHELKLRDPGDGEPPKGGRR